MYKMCLILTAYYGENLEKIYFSQEIGKIMIFLYYSKNTFNFFL